MLWTLIEEVVEVWIHAFLISALDGGEWSASNFGYFRGKDP